MFSSDQTEDTRLVHNIRDGRKFIFSFFSQQYAECRALIQEGLQVWEEPELSTMRYRETSENQTPSIHTKQADDQPRVRVSTKINLKFDVVEFLTRAINSCDSMMVMVKDETVGLKKKIYLETWGVAVRVPLQRYA